MKKIFVSSVALLLGVTMTGCGASGSTASTPTATPEPTVEPVMLEAESSGDSVFGTLEDTFRTVFFDFCITEVYSSDVYEDLEIAEDEQVIIATVIVSNVDDEDVEMYDTDFILLCLDDEGQVVDDMAFWPATAEGHEQTGEMLPEIYTVEAGQSVTGELVFVVPIDYKNFSICYSEEYADGTTGSYFFCDFYFD